MSVSLFRRRREGGRAVVQEYDAARLGERQIRSERAVVNRELFENLAVVRVRRVQPSALGGQAAAPGEREVRIPNNGA
jgi:hypothetical protein